MYRRRAGGGKVAHMAGGYSIRAFRQGDLPRLQEITAATFGPVSIDRNIEQMLGPFGQGDWRTRKAMAIADDCAAQPDGVFVAQDAAGRVVRELGPTTRQQHAKHRPERPNHDPPPVAPVRPTDRT